mmetsp:Transcript_143255/g.250047  ORF Transcript_143255/g.250047 Transcript_143255/m.250047 type:complete len:234 (-) Transcript_143255:265-966(-)
MGLAVADSRCDVTELAAWRKAGGDRFRFCTNFEMGLSGATPPLRTRALVADGGAAPSEWVREGAAGSLDRDEPPSGRSKGRRPSRSRSMFVAATERTACHSPSLYSSSGSDSSCCSLECRNPKSKPESLSTRLPSRPWAGTHVMPSAVFLWEDSDWVISPWLVGASRGLSPKLALSLLVSSMDSDSLYSPSPAFAPSAGPIGAAAVGGAGTSSGRSPNLALSLLVSSTERDSW